MDRLKLYESAQARLLACPDLVLTPQQTARVQSLGRQQTLSDLERMWAVSLVQAILAGCFVPEGSLHRITELVSHDNEGYLYFDGIRGDNAGDGIEPRSFLIRLQAKAEVFEQQCLRALLSGLTVQQRTPGEILKG